MCSFTVNINGIFALLIPAGILIIGSAVDYKEFLLNFIFYILFTPICTVMMTKIMFSGENMMLARDAVNRISEILNEKPLEEPEKSFMIQNYDIEFKNVIGISPKKFRTLKNKKEVYNYIKITE
ncbi:hypothetical protein [Clostridium butyricum]|uniref:hypothetical protein n=1 Tax=Clostridium butyricum TaxID=1492 RepID=UPI0034DB5950